MPLELALLNEATNSDFIDALGGCVEHSPWVAERVCGRRPFASVWALHAAMYECILQAPTTQQIALACLQPELAGREAANGTLTDASNAEQARLGLLSLSGTDHSRLAKMNKTYRAKFGFPFIVALRLQRDLASIFGILSERTMRDASTELAENMRQIGEVLRGRLARLFGTPLGWLSTHVLDSMSGGPAAGMRFDITVREGAGWRSLASGMTNAQGRTDAPVLVDAQMTRNVHQFEFQIGSWYQARGVALADLPFLDCVPLRFGIDDPDLHYHVPLLCTPWTYSTYRGS